MTTLLSWLSVDTRGPSAIYLAADSRITWGSGASRWDSGPKVFAAATPDVFGYCGDVVFPSLVLNQIVDLVGRGLLWDAKTDAEKRHAAVVDYLKTSFARRHNAPNHSFTVLHVSRQGSSFDCKFLAWRTEYYSQSHTWVDTQIDTSDVGKSKVIAALGSGNKALTKEIAAWQSTTQGETARAIFSAFCDALEAGADPLTGGMPQLVSLDRKSAGKLVGFIDADTRYLHGLPVHYTPAQDKIEWVDRLFNRISPQTLERLSRSQRYVRPRGI